MKKYWLVLLVAALLGAGALAYTLLRSSDATELVSGESQDPVVAKQSAEILTLLHALKRLSFNEALFNDPRFRSLVDFSVELTPEPKGRRNPFVPFGNESNSAVGTSTSAAATSTGSVP